ncbi:MULTISPECIES: hypothetical protein [unclassified Spirosoma]|uniref:hypothetical protein n=1 Tax=unclassified Spirosoma TaxID=2621999 RepID=UPI001AC41505|nr:MULTISPECIES: hypothetical protein [unclassified Spirosoma]MBN8824976.1 hypothetical protein [Spirosoma sp.]
MTTTEKKQLLIEKVQQIPESYYDDINQLLDTILADQEIHRRKRFEQLLTETSTKYKAVWEALA